MPILSLVVCMWVVGMVCIDAHCPALLVILCVSLIAYGCVMRQRSFIVLALACAAGGGRMLLDQNQQPAKVHLPDWFCVTQHQHNWDGQQLVAFNAVHTGIQLRVPVFPQYRTDDCLYIAGTLQPITSKHVAYLQQLHRQKITFRSENIQVLHVITRTTWRSHLEAWRMQTTTRIQHWIREPTATIMAGMLIGVSGDVTPGLAQAFQRSGTTHLLVISGWNISIVAWLCVTLAMRLPISLSMRTISVIGCIILYVFATGASAAVVRAGIMGCVAVLGKAINRPRHGMNLLAVATLVMSAYDTSTLWDIGFQLSTLATLGLILFGNTVDNALEKSPFGHHSLAWARESVAATLAAHITTWPIMLFRLTTPSPWSLLANIITAPVVPYAMLIGSLVLVLVWICPTVVPFVHWMVYPPFLWIITCSTVIATFPAPASLHIDSVLYESLCHALWVGWYGWSHRAAIAQTLYRNESGIVS